jgi:hypothetical protein
VGALPRAQAKGVTGSCSVPNSSNAGPSSSAISFLVGQKLVSFFNGTDHSSPPDWIIKNFTQQFMNYNKQNNFKIFKIRS